MELLQLLKVHLDYKERTKMLASCNAMTESAVQFVNPRLVSSDSLTVYTVYWFDICTGRYKFKFVRMSW